MLSTIKGAVKTVGEFQRHTRLWAQALAMSNVLVALGLGSAATVIVVGVDLMGLLPETSARRNVMALLFAIAAYVYLEAALFVGIWGPASSHAVRFARTAISKLPLIVIAFLMVQAAGGLLMQGHTLWALGLGAGAVVGIVTFVQLLEKDDPRSSRIFLDPSVSDDEDATAGIRTPGWTTAFLMGAGYASIGALCLAVGISLSFVIGDLVHTMEPVRLSDVIRVMISLIVLIPSIAWPWILLAGAAASVGVLLRRRQIDRPVALSGEDDISQTYFSEDERAYLTAGFYDVLARLRQRDYPDYFGWIMPAAFLALLIIGLSDWTQTVIDRLLQMESPISIAVLTGWSIAGIAVGHIFALIALVQSGPILAVGLFLIFQRYGEYVMLRLPGWRYGIARLHAALADDLRRGKVSVDRTFSPNQFLRRHMLGMARFWGVVRLFLFAGLAALFWP